MVWRYGCLVVNALDFRSQRRSVFKPLPCFSFIYVPHCLSPPRCINVGSSEGTGDSILEITCYKQEVGWERGLRKALFSNFASCPTSPYQSEAGKMR